MPDPISDKPISPSLRHDLVELSEIAANAKANPQRAAHDLKDVSGKTLTEINAQINTLNVSSEKFIAKIKDLIERGDWANLPPPKQMAQSIDQLMAINDAIRETQETILTDISAIMAILLEIQRKAALSKGDERIQERNAMLTSAKAEFMKREEAAKAQLIADVVQAGVQMATGVFSVVMSRKSIKQLKKANADTATAWDRTKELNKLRKEEAGIKTEVSKFSLEAPAAQKVMTELKTEKQLKGKLSDTKENQLKTLEGDVQAFHKKEIEATEKYSEIKEKQSDIDHLNSGAHELTQMSRARLDMMQAAGGAVGKLGELTAAGLKFGASLEQVSADKEALAKSLAQSGEQAALDAYQQLRDSLKSALQMIQAIEQAMAGTMTNLSRIS